MYSLLIADDEKIVIRGLLNSVNWKKLDIKVIGTATNGSEALDIIQNQKPDIAILDVRMPGLSGLDVIERSQNKSNTIFIIFSGYSEFEYAKRALHLDVLDYLLKPANIPQIEEVLYKAVSYVDQKRVLTKYEAQEVFPIPGQDKILTTLNSNLQKEEKKLSYCYSFYVLAIAAGMKKFHEKCNFLEKQLRSYKFMGVHAVCFSLSNFWFCVVGAEDSSTDEAIFSMVNEIIGKAKEQFQANLFWGLDGPCFHLEQLSNAILPAIAMLDYCAFTQSLFQITEWKGFRKKHSTAITQDFSGEKLRAFTDKILTRANDWNMKQELYQFLDSFLDRGYSSQEIRNICSELIYDLKYRIRNDLKYEFDDKIEIFDLLHSEVQKMTYLELSKWMEQSLEYLRTQIINAELNKKEAMVVRIKNYIEKHLNEELTLNKISEQVFLNPAYVSSLFKQETGKNLFDYIAQKRIDKATHLLRNSSLKINEIAHLLGFEDQRYFCQVFKKKMGISATEFRNNKNT